MDPSGFPELLEYSIKLADHNTMDLQLQLDRSLKIPPSAIQNANGQMENKQAPKLVWVIILITVWVRFLIAAWVRFLITLR